MSEVQRREIAALAAIRQRFGTAEGELNVDRFVLHHLDELDDDYWQRYLGTGTPEPLRVLDLLHLRSHWGDQDSAGMDVFDFTLPTRSPIT